MSQDDHRAPSRIDSSYRRRVKRSPAPPPDRARAHRAKQLLPAPQPGIREEPQFEEGPLELEEPFVESRGIGQDQSGSDSYVTVGTPTPPDETPSIYAEEDAASAPEYRDEYAAPEARHAISPGRMSTQEQYQLLIHNIQLCDDEWKLAGIRANKNLNWLTAYLIPRNKRIELKAALRRQMVLIISIDEWGNTDVKEPKKRGFWRALTSWFYNE